MRRRVAVAALLALAACTPDQATLIDGSSPEKFAATSEAARRDLAIGDRLAFDRAIKSPPGKRYGDTDKEVRDLARSTFDGMSAAEVVAYAHP